MLRLKVGICDDDAIYCHDIASRLDRYMMSNDVNISYQIFMRAAKILKIYDTPGKFDILFLDIEIPEIDGLILAQKVKRIDPHVFIIFVSNYPEYMQDSFRVHPFYYLVKPLTTEVFIAIMNDIISTIESEHKLVTLLYTDKTEETINIKDIRYIDVADGKKGILCFHFFNHITLAKGKLADWSNKLFDFDFYRCHRGFLVNMSHIHYFESGTVIMDNDEKVPLSRGKEKKLKEIYSNNIVRLKNL